MSEKRSPVPRRSAPRNSAKSRGKRPGARPRGRNPIPRNRRELAQGIFAARDPVDVGRELLGADSESVKARAFETYADWLYGPAGAATGGGTAGGVRIVWDLPAPPRKPK